MPHRSMFDDGFSNSFLDADIIKAHGGHLDYGSVDEQDDQLALTAGLSANGSLSPIDHSFLSSLSSHGRNSISGSAHSPGGNSFSSSSPSAWSSLLPGTHPSSQRATSAQPSLGSGQGPMISGASGDEWALGDTFDQSELDMLFFNDSGNKQGGGQGAVNMADWLVQGSMPPVSANGNGTVNASGQDATFDMLNLPASPTANASTLSAPAMTLSLSQQFAQQQQQQPQTFAQLDLGGMAGAAAWAQIQAEQMRQAEQLREIQRQQQMQFLEQQMSAAAAVLANASVPSNGAVNAAPAQGQDAMLPVPSQMPMAPAMSAQTSNEGPPVKTDNVEVKKPRGRPGRKPKLPSPDSPDLAPGPMGGKHNKTERRYRQKVQAAQAELRDAVPALRVLYGTSTPEQLATTDIKMADGSVDGLPEVSRPNASAKATILSGAKQYIELLQDRSAGLQRKVDELESYRLAVGGGAELERWRADFAQRESVKLAEARQMRMLVRMDDDDDDEGESEDEVQPKKAQKRKKSDTAAPARVFAAFAMSFSLVPSASTLLSHHPDIDITPGRVLAGTATPTQVIARLPLITAEHVHALIKRMVPLPIAHALVPSPGAMVDWTWRILVAVVLLLVLGPILQRWTGTPSGKAPTGAGNVIQIAKDMVGVDADDERQEWDEFAAAIAGRDITPSRLTKAHVLLRSYKTADSAYSTALFALLEPRVPLTRSCESLWSSAKVQLKPTDSAALRSVLSLPFEEARAALALAPATRTPLTAIAEQVALVHLSDLYSAQFVELVERTTASKGESISMLEMSAAMQGPDGGIEGELRHILQSVARGTVAHALALVLVGITAITSGNTSPAAQAALASSLAGEEMRGVPLQSVRRMLDLLYPAFETDTPSTSTALVASETALALDNVAVACIAYISLLVRYRATSKGNGAGGAASLSRKERQEVSRYIAKATGQIRVLLSRARCVGGATGKGDEREEQGPEQEQSVFEDAKEKLVGALALVGRRASSRAVGRDEDSGLEGDLEEL